MLFLTSLAFNFFAADVENNNVVINMKKKVIEIVDKTIENIHQYIRVYENYSYLWLDDRTELLYLFLKNGKVVTKAALEASEYEEIDDDDSSTFRPCLSVFKEQVYFNVNLTGFVYKITYWLVIISD